MLNTQSPKYLLLVFILFCHIFSMLLPANAALHTSLLANQNKNITAICSGNGKVRWINLSEYYQTGKLTFIEPEVENNQQSSNTQNACQICSLYNQLDNIETGLVAHALIMNNHSFNSHLSFIEHFTKSVILAPSSRDPPFTF